MFEKEAEEYAEAFLDKGVAEASFKKGAEFGYNKANEWHYVKDGIPTKSGRYLLCNLIKTKRKNYIITNIAEFDSRYETFGGIDNSTIYAWKEIVLPELKESE